MLSSIPVHVEMCQGAAPPQEAPLTERLGELPLSAALCQVGPQAGDPTVACWVCGSPWHVNTQELCVDSRIPLEDP